MRLRDHHVALELPRVLGRVGPGAHRGAHVGDVADQGEEALPTEAVGDAQIEEVDRRRLERDVRRDDRGGDRRRLDDADGVEGAVDVAATATQGRLDLVDVDLRDPARLADRLQALDLDPGEVPVGLRLPNPGLARGDVRPARPQRELDVLELINGRNSVKEIARRTRTGTFAVSRIVYRLSKSNVVRRRATPVTV